MLKKKNGDLPQNKEFVFIVNIPLSSSTNRPSHSSLWEQCELLCALITSTFTISDSKKKNGTENGKKVGIDILRNHKLKLCGSDHYSSAGVPFFLENTIQKGIEISHGLVLQ
jgi:hypothetical protein